MFKKIICILLILLIPCILIVYNNKTKQKPIDWEEIDVTSISTHWLSMTFYDITNTDDINTIMDCIKNIDYTNKIKAFRTDKSDVTGWNKTLIINHTNGTIKIIIAYGGKVAIEDSQVDYKRYCKITNDDYIPLFDTVVQYRPQNKEN